MNECIYTFQGHDITMNICIQIRAIVNQIMQRLSISFEEAMLLFYSSETYQILKNTENALWAESPEYIADCCLERDEK